MHIVGFAGVAGAGKSWAACEVARQSPYTTRTFHFSTPLREAIVRLSPRIRGEYYRAGWGAAKAAGARRFAQRLGDLTREFDPAFHVGNMLDDLQRCEAHVAIIDDVRFSDEVAMIKDMGGTVWYITEPHSPDLAAVGHHSETRPDGCISIPTSRDAAEAALAVLRHV